MIDAVERRKSDAERKSLIIPVRVNAKQKKALEKKAKARGIGLSTWLLQLGLAASDTPTSP
jgi:hypothetical protein